MAANELNSNFSTSEELLADSDSIVEELNRRMAIMDRAKELKADLEQDDFKIVQ